MDILLNIPCACLNSMKKIQKNIYSKKLFKIFSRSHAIALVHCVLRLIVPGSKLKIKGSPSVQHQKPLSSTPITPHFNINNPSVQHTSRFNTPLSSTHPSVQHTPQFNTKNLSVQHTSQFNTLLSSTQKKLTKKCFSWTEGFSVLNWGISGAEKMWSLCWTDVLNWGGHCGIIWYKFKKFVFLISNPTRLLAFSLTNYSWRKFTADAVFTKTDCPSKNTTRTSKKYTT